ncbi:tsa antioxidant enzyme domain protein [Colletotrichum incanum]|nr:tsa antioxidant enzyme domain protein [Colletotrichum incanum]
MLSSLTTKIALKKVGLNSKSFDFGGGSTDTKSKSSSNNDDAADESSGGWPAWMSMKSLPITVAPWFSPPPPPVPVAEVPKIGDLAPLDRDRKLEFGRGRPVLVVFLRCVGCAFAQKTFLALRALANKHAGTLTCIAVSHSSSAATQKWIDMLGGAWNVQVVIDEDRAVYAAWGLGLGSVWYVFNPTSQVQGWKEKGWLGEKVAGAIQRTGTGVGGGGNASSSPASVQRRGTGTTSQKGGVTPAGGSVVGGEVEGPSTVMGNKWQTAGAFAVDGRGTVVWGGKALRADDPMDLETGARILGL